MVPINNDAIAMLTKGLSPDEMQELVDVLDYLGERVPAGSLAEGSVATLLNKASPNVRNAIARVSSLMETPRSLPFQPKISERLHAELLGLDPQIAETTKSVLDTQHVADGVMKRMGTDSQLPQKPISDREIIEAAMAKHGA